MTNQWFQSLSVSQVSPPWNCPSAPVWVLYARTESNQLGTDLLQLLQPNSRTCTQPFYFPFRILYFLGRFDDYHTRLLCVAGSGLLILDHNLIIVYARSFTQVLSQKKHLLGTIWLSISCLRCQSQEIKLFGIALWYSPLCSPCYTVIFPVREFGISFVLALCSQSWSYYCVRLIERRPFFWPCQLLPLLEDVVLPRLFACL